MSNVAYFVPTRGSQVRGATSDDYKEVVIASRKPKAKYRDEKPSIQSLKEEETSQDKAPVFNYFEARHNVIKFGTSGMDVKSRQEAKVQQLIKLGAKPPKNRYTNYKKLLETKKKEKVDRELKQEQQQLGKNSQGKSTAKGKSFDRNRRPRKMNLLSEYGVVKKGNLKGTKTRRR